MRIFVTGGSGFIGGHLIQAFASEHEVFAMARSERSAAKVQAYGAQAVRCDLDSIAAEHLQEMDVVVHAAAYVEEWGSEEDYAHANVGGTERMVQAAQAAGVARFIQISTNATVIDGGNQRGVDEKAPYGTQSWLPYGRTKAQAEAVVLAANAPGFHTLALRPCFVWGPRDNSVLPAVLKMAEEGSFVWLDHGRARVSTTHVRNLCAAALASLDRGQGGQAYFIADPQDTTIRAFLEGLAGTQDVALGTRSVPGALLRPLSRLVEASYRVVGAQKAPPLTAMAVGLMSRDMCVRTERAREELGWEPVIDRDPGLAELRALSAP